MEIMKILKEDLTDPDLVEASSLPEDEDF